MNGGLRRDSGLQIDRALRLGQLTFSIEGATALARLVRDELSSCPASSDNVDIRYCFADELPDIDGPLTGHVALTKSGLRISDFGIQYDLHLNDEQLYLEVATSLPDYSNVIRRVRKSLDWTFIDPLENIAKNFMYNVFGWTIQLKQVRMHQSFIHASSITKDDQAIAILGWGGVGKTTSMLKLCLEEDWKFLSDDLGLIDTQGVLYRTPKWMQVYAYNTEGEPAILKRLMSGRSVGDRLAWTVRKRLRGAHKVRRRISPEVLLGKDRVAVEAKVTRFIFLERSSAVQPAVTPIGSEALAQRMSAIVMAEIEPFSSLARQAEAAGSRFFVSPGELQEQTRQILGEAFKRAEALHVTVPGQPTPDLLIRLLRPYLG